MSMTRTQAKQVGSLVARARLDKGLSLRELELQLGIPRSTLGALEHGRALHVAPDRLLRLAEVLDIEPAQLGHTARRTVADSLPEARTYFRAKYGLSAEQSQQVERYVRRLRSQA
jgi:transcriptional regulator with XRE-family HTH domain